MENFEWAPKAEKDDVVITLFSLLPAPCSVDEGGVVLLVMVSLILEACLLYYADGTAVDA